MAKKSATVEAGPDESEAIKRRRGQMYGQMLMHAMLGDRLTGLRLTAAALCFQITRSGADLFRLAKDMSHARDLQGFVEDHTRDALTAKHFPILNKLEDFAFLTESEALDVIQAASALLASWSISDKVFHQLVNGFGLDQRALWEQCVPTTEHAAAWLRQFKAGDLKAFASTLDPDNASLARVVAASKKGDAVEALAKALVGKAPGQPEDIQARAAKALPLGLGVAVDRVNED